MNFPSFLMPGPGQGDPLSGPAALERKRKMAESLMGQGMETGPIQSPWQGAARLAQALVGGMGMRRADQQELAGQASGRDALAKALTGGNDQAIIGAMSNPWLPQGSGALLAGEYGRLHKSPEFDYIKGENGQIYQYNKADPNSFKLMNEAGPDGTDPGMVPNGYGLSPVYGVDKDGNPVVMQLNKGGHKATQVEMPPDVQFSKEPIRLDAGDHWILLDPITRQQVGSMPKNLAGAESQKQQGEAQGKAAADLPRSIFVAQEALDTVEKLRAHPGLNPSVGTVEGKIPTWLGGMFNSDISDFEALRQQAAGGAFLQAYQSLKGGGSITEIEGEKATNAIARMTRAQSEDSFRAALNDYEDVIQKGLARAQQSAGVPQVPLKPNVPQQPPPIDPTKANPVPPPMPQSQDGWTTLPNGVKIRQVQ